MTVTFCLNEQTTFLSDEFVDLCKDKLDLDKKQESDDPELMAALYDALAEKFEQWSKYILAGNCRKHAAEWKDAIL